MITLRLFNYYFLHTKVGWTDCNTYRLWGGLECPKLSCGGMYSKLYLLSYILWDRGCLKGGNLTESQYSTALANLVTAEICFPHIPNVTSWRLGHSLHMLEGFSFSVCRDRTFSYKPRVLPGPKYSAHQVFWYTSMMFASTWWLQTEQFHL